MAIIIDATNAIAGRLASYAAKKALLGEEVVIVNANKSIITGNKKFIIENFSRKIARGTPTTGPYYPRQPKHIIRRFIRGMLPWKQPRGRNAFKKIKCYNEIPEELQGKTFKTLTKELKTHKYLTLQQISKLIAGK